MAKIEDTAIVSSDTFGVPGALRANAYQLPEGLEFDAWQGIGERLQGVQGAVQWWIGDWLNYGKRAYHDNVVGHDRYWLAIEAFGRDHATLWNYASIANRVPPDQRRDSLSFSHHEAVASLGADERGYWLTKAEAERLSVDALRRAIRDQGTQGRLSVEGAPAENSRHREVSGDVVSGSESEATPTQRYAPPATRQPVSKSSRSSTAPALSQLDILRQARQSVEDFAERLEAADPEEITERQRRDFDAVERELDALASAVAGAGSALSKLRGPRGAVVQWARSS